ncbi:MAG: hypothetical protein LBF55_01055, partial [Prevotellaceae bacterium]|jgi:hypothetical protein|nr:hypothetical protein [Prevotellaceae bacterium]
MEIIKIIAPWLPVLVAVYILIESRYYMLVLYRIVKKKITGKPASVLSTQVVTLKTTAPARESADHPCQYLLSCFCASIYSVNLGNEAEKFNDEESNKKFDDNSINEAFPKLLKSNEEIQ